MQYRDVRVEDLSADAPGRNATGPFAVAGVGPHTVEVRSVDAAGNVEAKQAVDFQIGAVGRAGRPVGRHPARVGRRRRRFRLGSLPRADRREAVRQARRVRAGAAAPAR